jgi:hypothetical protein
MYQSSSAVCSRPASPLGTAVKGWELRRVAAAGWEAWARAGDERAARQRVQSGGYMTHTLRVRQVVRWTQFNEYEGVIHGDLDGIPVTCYVLVPTTDWDSYRPGTAVEVDAWVERTGGVETLPPGSQATLTQVDGAVYEVAGMITQQDGEQVNVDSILPVRIDLDLRARCQPPRLRTGDVIRVRGILKVDLPDGPA